ncbi:MAG: hypothetical protein ACJ77K_03215 [Bacteroidia bacterium]
MKLTPFISAAILSAAACHAQDIITMKNGDEKSVKVIEVTPSEIKFKKSDNPDGPTYSEEKSRVFMVKYENGAKDVFNQQPTSSPADISTTAGTAPQVQKVGPVVARPNSDLIINIVGDSIHGKIDQITGGVMYYHIQRSGMDEKKSLPMNRIATYYRDQGENVKPVEFKVQAAENKAPTVQENDEDEFMPEARKYGGPRLGMTYVGPGLFADALAAEGKRNVYSQFGWQVEKRLFTTVTGISAVVEFVPLIGGLDMGKFIPSASALIGIRSKKGIEFGAGPTAAVYGYKGPDGYYNTSSSFGVVIASGWSFKSDKVYFPINLAFIPSVGKVGKGVDEHGKIVQKKYETGAKLSLLVGFNYRKR